MGRTVHFEMLTKAQLHVLQGTARVNRQREIINVLERDGPGRLLPEATRLLRHFEKALAFHIEDRDRLTEELAKDKAHQSGA